MSGLPLRGAGVGKRRPRPAMALASLLVSGLPATALLALAALSKNPPPTVAAVRLLTMFTVESNAGLALVAWCIWRDRGVRHPAFALAWNAAVVGAMLTGAVAAVWMRPTLRDGVNPLEVADLLLHVAGPILGLALWLSGAALDPSAGRWSLRRWSGALCWPAAWVGWVLLLGAGSDWYPYRQLDPHDAAALPRWQSLTGIATLVVTATVLAALLDRRFRRAARSGSPTSLQSRPVPTPTRAAAR